MGRHLRGGDEVPTGDKLAQCVLQLQVSLR